MGKEESTHTYNIIQLDEASEDYDVGQFPAVHATLEELRFVGEFPPPPLGLFAIRDMLDWLGAFFGFQSDNVKNQREHIVLLLANHQMQRQHSSEYVHRLDSKVVQAFRKKLLKNYILWCSFLNKEHNLWLPKKKRHIDSHRELLYCCLYLLIWGEAANIRFMPECICFIFHHMAMEMNVLIEKRRSEGGNTPYSFGPNNFLNKVVKPIYKVVQEEAESANGGKVPHSCWRNYDDMNEFFWSSNCFTSLSWPLKLDSDYLISPRSNLSQRKRDVSSGQHKVGKTGFVEQRSFWNVFRSFDHLWTGLILMMQTMLIIAFNGDGLPWHVVKDRDVQLTLLTVFVTWSGLRLTQVILDLGMQYSLISRGTKLIGLRMLLKIVVASCWTGIFYVLRARIQNQRDADKGWSAEANLRLFQFLEAALVFLLPELLAIILLFLPWVRNLLEKSEWRVFHALTWWFQSRLFVGRGLREGVIDSIRYTAFWLMVLSAKFSFSYFLEVRPLVDPTRELLNTQFVGYQWHEFFSNRNRFLVLLLWAPVVLIYVMDLQIWYSIFSALVGGFVGLSSHIGEIRNVEQFNRRFPFFASAIGFNLMPDAEGFIRAKVSYSQNPLVSLAKDMFARINLRYGLVTKAYKRFEGSTLQSRKFALLWNKIIFYFRREDLLSDHEVELLVVPEISPDVTVMQWPTVLLSNELLVALGFTQRKQLTKDTDLWKKITKSEYRRCAVIECYESTQYLLKSIVKEKSIEYKIIELLFQEIKRHISNGNFSLNYRVKELEGVHARMVALVQILMKKPGEKDSQKVVSALQDLYDVVTRDLPTERRYAESRRKAGLLGDQNELLFVNAVKLPKLEDEAFFSRLRRLHAILTTKGSMSTVPKNVDARRRIAFFSNSLFMNMPRAPPVDRMLSFSVLTPYYSEDVSYTKEQLRTPNEDGITILFYLQNVFPDEWQNFLERMKCQDGSGIELWNDKETMRELRMWASYRGQTLARTVRGMTYYQSALEILAMLDEVSEIKQSSWDVMENMSRRSPKSSAAQLKFTYVVACQIYGVQKTKKDIKADEISFLMKAHPAMRVAYVDEVFTGEDRRYYSVLVKYDKVLEKEVEIYRVQLPGPLKLGEGKPENQNHALIFTRGDAVQTIDMNQDNNFEEALKVRNLLEEFTRFHGLETPKILGLREHVLTGPVSSVAHFMSSQEMSFVTLGQRVLAKPLKVRMHYGHPDFFDRLWFLTRGGISKASKVINISEDIFAGFNCTLRGGNVTHHEYIQVGKGRDVGLNQIALFEAKVSSGNGEQLLSRDVYRLGHHLDFFRMLSFYHSTVGFYINNMIIVLSVYAFLWGRVYIALSGLEEAIGGSLNNSALAASINQQFIVQLGFFTALPMVVENCLELGFSGAVWDFLVMQVELCSVFFTFSLGTKCHYFGRTLLHGGAKYRATGRGFVLKREKFTENYRLYARSHFQKGVELIILLIIYAAYGSSQASIIVYVISTFSSWFMALSWLMAPFLFNPTGFDWLQTVYDFEDFWNWLWFKGGSLIRADQSWEVWWNEEHDHLRTTDFWGKLLEVILSLRFFLIQYGLVYRLHIAANNKSVLVYFVSWIYVLSAMALYLMIAFATETYAAKKHLHYRAIQLLASIFITLVFVLLIELTEFRVSDFFLSSLAFLPTGWGILSICLAVKPFLVNTMAWPVVVALARLYELAMGTIVMIPLAILSWLPGFQAMQSRILFNQAFSKGLLISRLLSGKKSNQS